VDHAAEWDAAQYDGLAPDQPDLLATPTIHAIYLHPSNGHSRFGQFAAMFQADAAQASALVGVLYGKGLRFDMRKGGATAKNPDGVFLDITVVRSKYNAKQVSSSRQFSLVRDEVAAKFKDADKKYVVWLDAGSRYCGQGELYQDPEGPCAEQQPEAHHRHRLPAVLDFQRRRRVLPGANPAPRGGPQPRCPPEGRRARPGGTRRSDDHGRLSNCALGSR
jgi:hypothetical protein